MKNIITYLTILVVVFSSTEANAQDVIYSQPYVNPGTMNPALTGLNNTITAALQYRQQWSSIENGYITYGFTGMYPLFMKDGKEKLDFGLYASNNKESAFSKTSVAISAGYNIRISDAGHINVSLLVGYNQNALSTSGLSFDDQYVLGSYSAGNPTAEVISAEKTSFVDLGAGAMWYYTPEEASGSRLNAFVGVGAFHLNKPNDGFAGGTMKLQPRYTGQAGVKIIGKGNIDFIPNFYYVAQGGMQLFAPGIMMDYRAADNARFGIGGWLKAKNSITVMASVTYSLFQLGYSYDITHSQLNNYITELPVHEVTLTVRFGKSELPGRSASPMF